MKEEAIFSFLKKKSANPEKDLRDLLGDFSLPSFPSITTEIMGLLRDQDATADQIAEVSARDPELTVKILGVVNSAAYSARRRVESLRHAIVMLGVSNLEMLVLSVAVKDSLPRPECSAFDGRRFWRTAARRASIARQFSDVMHTRKSNFCFTAGLLQDMAIPLIARSKPEVYGPILDSWLRGEAPLHELEAEEFGWDHAEVATWLCDHWGLPEQLAESIGGHHGAADLECPPALQLVAHVRESKTDDGVPELLADAESRFGIDAERGAALVAQGDADAQSISGIYS